MASIRIFAKGWNFSQDGPGNRLLYHFQGCNFFCPWCSNPEGIASDGTLMVKEDNIPPDLCPHDAITSGYINRDNCNACSGKECLHRNRNEFISWSARSVTIDETVYEIEQAKGLFHTGGGVTFTGGEPTLQFDALKELINKLHERGIHTVVETNGTHTRLPELFPLLDLVIIDLKHPDPEKHKEVTRASNRKTMENIQLVAATDCPVWIRIPLIPGFNDSPEVIDRFIEMLTPIRRPDLSVELLTFHEYGKVKWQQCGMEYTMPSVSISSEQFKHIQNSFINHRINLINT